ncbi:WD40 repeat domain-containing protein [Vermiphilus pyriformis]|nr:MAG: WD40 repeat domain-containing protein [Vermiphilus pyriformis]
MKILYYVLLAILSSNLACMEHEKKATIPSLTELAGSHLAVQLLDGGDIYSMCTDKTKTKGQHFFSKCNEFVKLLLKKHFQNFIDQEHISMGNNRYYKSLVKLNAYSNLFSNNNHVAFVAVNERGNGIFHADIYLLNPAVGTCEILDIKDDVLSDMRALSLEQIQWSPVNIKQFACIVNNMLCIYELDFTTRQVKLWYTNKPGFTTKVHNFEWSPDGKAIVVKCENESIVFDIIDVQKRQVVPFVPSSKIPEPFDQKSSFKWNETGTVAICALKTGNVVAWTWFKNKDDNKRRWKYHYGILPCNKGEGIKQSDVFAQVEEENDDEIYNVWNEQCTQFVYFRCIEDEAEDIILYSYAPDEDNLQQVAVLESNLGDALVDKLHWCPNGNMVGYIKNACVKIHKIDTESNTIVSCELNNNNLNIKDFAWNIDGTSIVVVYNDNTLKVWSLSEESDFGYIMQNNYNCDAAPEMHTFLGDEQPSSIVWNPQGTAFYVMYADEMEVDGANVKDIEHYRIIAKDATAGFYRIVEEIRDIASDSIMQWYADGSNVRVYPKDNSGNIHTVYVACPSLATLPLQMLVLAGRYASRNDKPFDKNEMKTIVNTPTGPQPIPLYALLPQVAKNMIDDNNDPMDIVRN